MNPVTVTIPTKPTEQLLASMAQRHNHAYGLWDAERQAGARLSMRQVHEEVVGTGFYRAPACSEPLPHAMNPAHNTPQPLTDADLDAMQALAEADHAATEAFRTASHASRKVNDAALNAFFVFNAEARPFVPRAIAALRAARAVAEDAFQEAARLTEENTALRRFKQYVHDRLDAVGIDPHQEQNALNGCRIGARLDDVFQLAAPASPWVPVSELSAGQDGELLYVLIPAYGSRPAYVQHATYLTEYTGDVDPGQDGWHEYDEVGYVRLDPQPTHYHPAPLAPAQPSANG